jgi:hypothetical protein
MGSDDHAQPDTRHSNSQQETENQPDQHIDRHEDSPRNCVLDQERSVRS